MGKRVVDVEERLPWYQALPLGLQHFLSMFGATVLVPMLMGFSPSVSVMCSGIGTALYLVATKGKIPSYLGPSFSFVGPVVIAVSYTHLYELLLLGPGLLNRAQRPAGEDEIQKEQQPQRP